MANSTIYRVSLGGGSSTPAPAPYDIGAFVPDKPADGKTMLEIPIVRALTLPAGLTGSRARARVAPTGAVSLSLQKNGVEFGTMNFAAGAQTATFTVASSVSLADGDRVTVIAPSPQDDTLSGVNLMLKATR